MVVEVNGAPVRLEIHREKSRSVVVKPRPSTSTVYAYKRDAGQNWGRSDGRARPSRLVYVGGRWYVGPCEVFAPMDPTAGWMTSKRGIERMRVLGATNTQTRRLGYLVALCEALGSEYVPPLDLQNRVEAWADRNNEKLGNHVSDKGVMRRSARSLGFKRYLELAQNIELIVQVSGYFRLSKLGRVLILAKNLDVDGVDPFGLGERTSFILLYQLLLLDADYLLPILELTARYHGQTELLENAQERLQHRFDLMQAYARSPIPRSDVVDRARAIARWTKPEKYLEHLLLPRLHWLLDLGLLDWGAFRSERQFEPSKWGRRLLLSIPRAGGEPFVDRRWCQNALIFVRADDLDSPTIAWSELPETRQRKLIQRYVREGFSLFRTMQYPRISAYQVVLFVILRLLFDERIVAGFGDVRRALDMFSRSGHPQWTFFWSDLDDDGYLLIGQ